MKSHNTISLLSMYALSGLLTGLSVNTIGGFPLSALAWVSFIPLFLALKNSASIRIHVAGVYLFSCVTLLMFLFSFISVYASAGLLLITIGSIVSSVPLWVSLWFKHTFGWKNTLLIIPFFWTAYLDIIADQLFALPILSFSLSQAPLTWLIQYVDITGHTAIVFWLLVLNVTLTFTLDRWKIGKNSSKSEPGASTQFLIKRFGMILLLLFLPPLLYAFYTFQTLPQEFKGSISVGLVQPGSVNAEYTPELAGELVEKHVSLTDSLINQHNVDLVVWSEGAVGFPLLEDTSAVNYLFQNVLHWQTPVLTGTFERDYYASEESIPSLQEYLGRNYALYNSAMMITPQLAWMHLKENLPLRNVIMYNKAHLMPFTEYVPFSDKIPALSKLSVYGSDFYHFSKGTSPEYLAFAAKNEWVHRVSPIICWDLLSTNSSSIAIQTNAQFIAALTNESALGDFFRVTAHEMESYTRLRSIESRRSIAKASMTGYTLFTNPFGEAFGKVPWWSEQTSVERIPLTNYKSVYAQHSAAYSTLNLLLLVGMLILIYRKPFFKK